MFHHSFDREQAALKAPLQNKKFSFHLHFKLGNSGEQLNWLEKIHAIFADMHVKVQLIPHPAAHLPPCTRH
jgi:hypothetical protein